MKNTTNQRTEQIIKDGVDENKNVDDILKKIQLINNQDALDEFNNLKYKASMFGDDDKSKQHAFIDLCLRTSHITKIETYAKRHVYYKNNKLNMDHLLKRISSDPYMYSDVISIDAGKQTTHEKIQIAKFNKEAMVLGKNFKSYKQPLSVYGRSSNVGYPIIQKTIQKTTIKENTAHRTKKVDLCAVINGILCYIWFKYTKEGGGGQDETRIELEKTIRIINEYLDYTITDELFFLMLDGGYWAKEKIINLKELCNHQNIILMDSNNLNFYFNTITSKSKDIDVDILVLKNPNISQELLGW